MFPADLQSLVEVYSCTRDCFEGNVAKMTALVYISQKYSYSRNILKPPCINSVSVNKKLTNYKRNPLSFLCMSLRTEYAPNAPVVDSSFCVLNLACWSQWPRGLKRRTTAARVLRSWVRISGRYLEVIDWQQY